MKSIALTEQKQVAISINSLQSEMPGYTAVTLNLFLETAYSFNLNINNPVK